MHIPDNYQTMDQEHKHREGREQHSHTIQQKDYSHSGMNRNLAKEIHLYTCIDNMMSTYACLLDK